MNRFFEVIRGVKQWLDTCFSCRTGESVRGQLYASDALLSLVVFAFALALIAGINYQLVAQSDSTNQADTQDATAMRTINTLLSTPGEPVYWETLSDRNTVKSVGLANHRSGISVEKWNAFVDWNADDYSSLKQWMGLGGSDFYVSIADINRTVVGYAGIQPTDVNSVSVVVFPSVYQQKLVVVQVQVYRT